MENNLKVSNMVFTGRLPFKRKLKTEETHKLVTNFDYFCVNEECSPIFGKRIKIREKISYSVHHKEKQPYVSIWCSGAIIITGVVSKNEANKIYDIVISELKKFRGLLS